MNLQVCTSKESGKRLRRGASRLTFAEKPSRLGLESVRVHRLGHLENEISEWQRQMKEKSRFSPDIIPLIVAVVE